MQTASWLSRTMYIYQFLSTLDVVQHKKIGENKMLIIGCPGQHLTSSF